MDSPASRLKEQVVSNPTEEQNMSRHTQEASTAIEISDTEEATMDKSSHISDVESSDDDSSGVVTNPLPKSNIVLINNRKVPLTSPSRESLAYISYRWKKNSCAFDTSLEILFVVYRSGLLDNMFTRQVPPESPVVYNERHIVSFSSLVQLLRRRDQLHTNSEIASDQLQALIGVTRTSLQRQSIEVTNPNKNHRYASIWVSSASSIVLIPAWISVQH